MQKWQKFSKDEISKIVKNSTSYSEIAQKLGYKPDKIGSGKVINTTKAAIRFYGIDDSHIRKLGWNKEVFNIERFKENTPLKASNSFNYLVYLKGYKCECCGNFEWLGKPIQLEVHHIDGDNTNNKIENLQLLCPNCHSMTENWTGRNNIGPRGKVSEKEFVEALKTTSTINEAIFKVGLKPLSSTKIRAQKLIIKHSIENQKINIESKGVLQIDINTHKVVNIYNSCLEALKYLNLNKNNTAGMSKAIKYHVEYKGYFWVRDNTIKYLIGDDYPISNEFKTLDATETELLEALKNTSTIEEALKKVGLRIYKYNLEKAQNLIDENCISNQIGKNGYSDRRYKYTRILQKDKEGNILNTFNGLKEVCSYLNIKYKNCETLKNAINNNKIYKNYYWEKVK